MPLSEVRKSGTPRRRLPQRAADPARPLATATLVPLANRSACRARGLREARRADRRPPPPSQDRPQATSLPIVATQFTNSRLAFLPSRLVQLAIGQMHRANCEANIPRPPELDQVLHGVEPIPQGAPTRRHDNCGRLVESIQVFPNFDQNARVRHHHQGPNAFSTTKTEGVRSRQKPERPQLLVATGGQPLGASAMRAAQSCTKRLPRSRTSTSKSRICPCRGSNAQR
jgi:hypothetical protein